MTYRILLVDDQALFRQGLRALLAAHAEFAVVGEAGDAHSAQDAALSYRPDIVIIEVALSGTRGAGLIESLKRRQPAMRILALTLNRDDEMLSESLRAGADAYLAKDTSIDELVTALHSVGSGHRYLSPSVSGHLVDAFLSHDRRQHGDSPLDVLTTRERDVLQLIARGGSNRRVGEALGISTKTIEKHRANLMRKLGLRNAAELLMLAVETGLVQRPGSVSRLVPRPAAD